MTVTESEDDIPLQSWVRTYDGINACNRVRIR